MAQKEEGDSTQAPVATPVWDVVSSRHQGSFFRVAVGPPPEEGPY